MTSLPAMSQPLADVLSRLDRVRPQGNGRGWMASCPGPNHARGDRNPSLSIAVGDDNCVLLRCFAEARCTADSIVAALGLTTADLFEQRNGASPRPVPPRRPAPAPSSNDTAAKIEEPERKETGRVRYPLPDPVTREAGIVHIRINYDTLDGDTGKPTKSYRWERNGSPGLDGLPAAAVPLYGPWADINAHSDCPLAMFEGEGVADSANERDLGELRGVAVACGASIMPTDDVLRPLLGHPITLFPDNDATGRALMVHCRDRLLALGHDDIRWLEPPTDAPPKWDLADHSGTDAEVRAWVATATAERPGDGGELDDEALVVSVAFVVPEERAWPDPPGDDAYHGFAGRFVWAIDPHTEGDPVAVLTQLLVAFGIAAGSEPHMMVGATRHPARENVVIVGRTSKARKGDSRTPVQAGFYRADTDFATLCTHSGLSTGEGLIFVVRDQVEREVPIKEKGVIVGYQTEIVDQGVEDKRALVVESEYARVLRVAGREGNTLSAVLRQAFDGDDRPLRVMTRTNPLQATAAHIGIIGHITEEELRRELSDTEIANGFANRTLFVAVKRSKLLPNPEPIPDSTLAALGDELRRILDFAKAAGEMQRDASANELWNGMYASLSAERNGMIGALTARSEAHVLRISMIYALLDKTTVIGVEHLKAAVEVWAYCERSIEYLFGTSTGNPTADRIASALRMNGELDRTAIRDLFGRNAKGADLDHALEVLLSSGLVRVRSESTGGRPREIWTVA